MKLAELDNQKVAIWGWGKEGQAALRALQQHAPHAEVMVVTDNQLTEQQITDINQHAVAYFSDQKAANALSTCQVVIKSPGIPKVHPTLAKLKEAKVVITSGTNLWLEEHQQDTVIGITGSKGKSTTASLVAHLLAGQGYKTQLLGNIGKPLLDYLDTDSTKYWVLELSSYQTSDLQFSPTVGVLLNLYREHIDWHGSEGEYYADKLNMFGHRDDMYSVCNYLDPKIRDVAKQPNCHWYGNSEQIHPQTGSIYDGQNLLIDKENIPLLGVHNQLNLCAALTVMKVLDIKADFTSTLHDFKSLPHRLESAGFINGVEYIDDSISTIPQATAAALEVFVDRTVTLLVGGHDRRQDYLLLAEALKKSSQVKTVIAMPDNGDRILATLREQLVSCQLILAPSLERAVLLAKDAAAPGEVVLLSPGTASYGQFENFEARGRAFRAAAGL